MKKVHCLVLLAALCTPAFAFAAPGGFDYAKTQTIYAVTDNGAFAYARFPMFLAFRELIAERMANAQAGRSANSPALFTFRLVGVGELGELQIGKDWISDGMKTASLSEEDFRWVERAVAMRAPHEGLDDAMLEHSIRYQLAQQDDPAWQPM